MLSRQENSTFIDITSINTDNLFNKIQAAQINFAIYP